MLHTEYRSIRRSLGTQEEVAEMLGVSRQTLIRKENGTAPITDEDSQAMRALVPEQVTLPVAKRNLDATPKRDDLDPLTANILHWYVDPGYVLSK